MTTKQLRNKILDLAIHGRLVPQDANDEPASTLLARIRAEKEQLVKEGKLKKKDLVTAPVSDEDKPFDVPEGWEWCRLEDLCTIKGGKRIPIGHTFADGITNHVYIRVSDMKNGTVSLDDLHYISDEVYEKIKQYIITKDDIYMTIVGATIGKCGIIPEELNNQNLTENAARIIPYKISQRYLLYSLTADFCQDQFVDKQHHVGVPKMALSRFATSFIPLPPLAEQHRIVAAIEQWMSLVDIIESGQENLQQSIALAKNKILNLAIKGKLVEKEGEWEEKTGKEIFEPLKSTKPAGEYFNYIDIDAIDNKRCRVIEPKRVLVTKAPSRASRHTQRGDVLFSMVRPYLRNIALVEEDNCIASTGFYVCRSKLMIPKFCYYLMISEYVVQGLNAFMKGDNSPSINNKNILDFKFPLPPLSEQHRIVSKIEELFAQLDTIANALT